MDNLIIIPESIRGLGNIVDKKESSDFTTFNTNLFTTGSEVINDSTRTIFQIEYENEQLYFLEFPTKVISGVNQTITAKLKNSNGNPINNATVRLYLTSNNYVSSTSNAQGVITFNNVNLVAGSYEMYMIYNNIKSGKILITCVNVNTISVPDFIVTCKNQLLRVPIIICDDNSHPISNIPLKVNVQGNNYNLTTDEDGTANFNEYIGNELGDVSAHIQCGNEERYFTINDCIFYMYDGQLAGEINAHYTGENVFSTVQWYEDGFRIYPVTPISSTVNVSGTGSSQSSGSYEWLIGNFSNVIVEFTYIKSSDGGMNFMVRDENANIVFQLTYDSTNHQFRYRKLAYEWFTLNGTLNEHDYFKLVFSDDTVSIYQNGTFLNNVSLDTSENLLIGFREYNQSSSHYYDKFMIKVNGVNGLKSILLNKGITHLVNSLTYVNNVIQYSTLNVESITSLSDFNGVIYNLRKSDGNIKFDTLTDFEYSWGVVASTREKLESAVTSLSYNSTTGDINFETVGDLND